MSLRNVLLSAGALWSQLSSTHAQSTLGTTDQSNFPFFLTSGAALRTGTPWGTNSVSNANPYTQQPWGSLRTYDFTISRGTASPDGTPRSVLLVNGQYPGPTIEANWGDTIQVTMHNNITGPGEPTSLHWHGLTMSGTPWEDGVPGVSQCPVPPRSSHTYSFKADLYGTSFYHGHYSAQYTAGVYGAMIIYGPWSHSYTQDKGPVLLTDWGHNSEEEQVIEAVEPGHGVVMSDTSLINGRTNANFTFTSGQSYRLRLINGAAEAPYTFSIDEHNFTVIAHDFVPVNPFTASSIRLGSGQRADIIVKATGNPNRSYWMRSAPNDRALLKTLAPAMATIFYEKAPRNAPPQSIANTYDTGCAFAELPNFGTPAYAMSPPSQPATTETLAIEMWTNATGNPILGINNGAFHADYNAPPLLLAHAGNLSGPSDPSQMLLNLGSNSSVRLIVTSTDVYAYHPMHMHGHNPWILAEGYGTWDGKVQTGANPPRRDTVMLSPARSPNEPAFIVLEYMQDNPGVWPFHCHIAWHVADGLLINLVERPDRIRQMNIPSKMQDDCAAFRKWEKTNIVDEIDSGV